MRLLTPRTIRLVAAWALGSGAYAAVVVLFGPVVGLVLLGAVVGFVALVAIRGDRQMGRIASRAGRTRPARSINPADIEFLMRTVVELRSRLDDLGGTLAEGTVEGHDLVAADLVWREARGLEPRSEEVAAEIELIRGSGFFDPDWYRREAGHHVVAPIDHYVAFGGALGLDPHPLFPTTRYVESHPDALARWRTPLPHFLSLRDSGGFDRGLDSFSTPVDEADLKMEYWLRGIDRLPDTFVLYRILGNDLPPRHRPGQTLANLQFILEHEPDFEACEKRWVVNRIVDHDVEAEIIGVLESAGMEYLRIPFDLEEYGRLDWRVDGFPTPGITYRPELEELLPYMQQRAVDHLYHHKILYVMNNNGARNAALSNGRGRAKWILPWDGNCFITREGWEGLRSALEEQPHLKYFLVPMARLNDNRTALIARGAVDAPEEPQVVFRSDASEAFDSDLRYGQRPKVDLFYRIGAPGPWDAWQPAPWEPPRPSPVGVGGYGHGGWVFRLNSGVRAGEEDLELRGQLRRSGSLGIIDGLDEELAAEHFRADGVLAMDASVLAAQRDWFRSGEPSVAGVVETLVARADDSLRNQVYSVVSKTTLPPSGDKHDYWHPAPYWWPNPDTPDGLPYIRRDGHRRPGTSFGDPEASRYDRSSLQSMIDETMVCALAGFFTGNTAYVRRGADLVRAWFIEPSTRMNPHLRFAQVRSVAEGAEGDPSGVIEASDFYYLLDAVRLLEHEGALGGAADGVREWFAEYVEWLSTSDQGLGERAALNNHGTWYDVQMAAIQGYLGDLRGLLDTLRRSHERIPQQFDVDGSQPEELARTMTKHYCHYNLQGWMVLAAYSRRLGWDLWDFETPEGHGLTSAVAWVRQFNSAQWPYRQDGDFDADRGLVLAEVSRLLSGAPMTSTADAWTVKQVFSPHDGIRPFWVLGAEGGMQ